MLIGTLVLHASDCAKATNILDKNTLTGQNKASDKAFGLAAQLLAAKLNVAAGARTCPASVLAITDAQTALQQVALDGIAHSAINNPTGTTMTQLATTLSNYNNDLLC